MRFSSCKKINLANVYLEKGIHLENNFNTEAVNRETARFIKHEFLKINNQIEALRWHTKEMDLHLEDLSKNKGAWRDRWILQFEKYMSEYGTDPLLVVFISFAYCVVFLLLFYWFVGDFTGAIYYLISFWPPRLVETQAKDLGFWFYVVWALKNIAFVFLVYEFQKSFRKFSRKL